MTNATAVQGHCPLGHGQSLRLEDDGRIMCGDPFCERPYAVTDLISHQQTGHLVKFGDRKFDVTHPLSEMLDNATFDCDLYDVISALAGPPVPPGIYRAVLVDDLWTWGIPVTADTPPLPEPEPAADEPLPVAESLPIAPELPPVAEPLPVAALPLPPAPPAEAPEPEPAPETVP